MRLLGFTLLFAAGTCCFAQDWSVGLAGGYSFYNNATIDSAAGNAEAGFTSRFAAGAALGENVSEHIGGELRYTFLDGFSQLSSQGTRVNMSAYSNDVHYDFLFYATPRRARVRPYAAVGGGIKRYDGVGRQLTYEPLSNFAVLDKGHQVEGMLSVGGGVKFSLGDRWEARLDFRDYATPFPTRLFAVPTTSSVHGWLNDFVPMIGIDYTFGGR